MVEAAGSVAAGPQQGDCVEVFGLESENGQELNGQRGIVTGAFLGNGRLQVRLSPDKVVSLKAESLKGVTLGVQERLTILGLAPAKEAGAAAAEPAPAPTPTFEPGQRVEVFGLESEGGRALNLEIGTIVKLHLPGKDRYEVKFASNRVANIKPEHLRVAPEKTVEQDLPFHTGHVVEAVGLASALGKELTGQTGIVRRYFQEKGRFEVSFSDKIVSLKPENLKKVEFNLPGEKQAKEEAAKAPEAKEPAAAQADPAASPPAEAAKEAEQPPARSCSRSSSSSSSSRSRSRSRSPRTEVEQKFEAGWHIEITGLSSEAGQKLNGLKGTVLRRLPGQDKCRYEVCLGPEKFLSLKPVNMVRSETGPCMEADAKAAAPTPKKEEKKGSLASLLSLGRGPSKEEVKPETWQSVFQRSASDTLQSVTEGHKLTEDDLDYLRSLDRNQERIEEEKTSLRRKVAAELASQGAYDEDMVEELFKQQWEELQLQRLLRPQDSTGLSTSSKLQNRDRSRSRSRSGSSSSSSSNDGDAEETPKAAAED